MARENTTRQHKEYNARSLRAVSKLLSNGRAFADAASFGVERFRNSSARFAIC